MIYHYTDLNAAKSIAERSEIWLTDFRYLNDKEEFTKGYNVLCEALENYNNFSEVHPETFQGSVKRAIKFIIEDNFSSMYGNNIFVSSFSKTPDLLSQWRSYGMYCLEFDGEYFKEENIYLLECHYVQNEVEALEYADTIIEQFIMPALLDSWKKSEELFIDLELSSLLEIYALSFKHSAFYDEDEVRFVMSCSPDDERIEFRIKGQFLIPYVSYKFNPSILKTLIVGPIDNQEIAVVSLDMFANKIARRVREKGYNNEYYLLTETSNIPYRSL